MAPLTFPSWYLQTVAILVMIIGFLVLLIMALMLVDMLAGAIAKRRQLRKIGREFQRMAAQVNRERMR